jgi:hypothetical protein
MSGKMLSANDVEINLIEALENIWGFLPRYRRSQWYETASRHGTIWHVFFGDTEEDSYNIEVRQYSDNIGTIDFRLVDGEIWKWDMRVDVAIWTYDTIDFSNILRKLRLMHLLLRELK